MHDELDDAQLRYLQLLTDAGCKILFRTELPYGEWAVSKNYVWMKSPEGTIFLESIPND